MTDGTLLGAPLAAGPARLGVEELIDLVEASGLGGRGGAGFPTARKLRSVAGRRPVVVGNAIEGEPLSAKDAVLLSHNPGLVLEGLRLVARALRARRTILTVGPGVPAEPVSELAHGSGVAVMRLPGGFVAGQESALVNLVNGRRGLPSDPLTPVFESGVDRRPTLVCNVETLAHLALIARHGAAWFRSRGTADDPGTFLTTLSSDGPGLVAAPGVIEAERGTTLHTLLEAGETDLSRVRAVLVGGYHGAWVPGDRLETPVSGSALLPYAASPGAGVVHALDVDRCPLDAAARIAAYLAQESAGQCGPCVNGLPRMASALTRLARPGAGSQLPGDLTRLLDLVRGRGACAHPDGTARFVASTMRVFSDHVDLHLEGACDARARRLDSV